MRILVLNGSPKGEYSVTLQPGKYVFCTQSDESSVELSWSYVELKLEISDDIEKAFSYKIYNYYGDVLDGIKFICRDDKLIVYSQALKDNKFTVYSAMPVKGLPGEVKFSVEETDFGRSMAIIDGVHGLEAAPQLRNPNEIIMVFKNEPKVKEIKVNRIGGEGRDIVEISFEALGIDKNSKEFWFDISADIPEVSGYRYPFTMFHSVRPRTIAHMFARAKVK